MRINGLRCFDYGSEVKVIKKDGTVTTEPATYFQDVKKKKKVKEKICKK